ncbi:MAG: ATP-dependent DNA helicase RecG [Campylobacterota bacterium]|nr:ATP-dependent DNA helicase RecG [Campylobacterota bacterium]
MQIDKKDEEKFKRLGIDSALSLATIAPSSYEDRQIYHQVVESAQIIDATIERVSKTPNSLQITFYAHNLSCRIQGVLFKPKPYMSRAFNIDERAYFFGKIGTSQGHFQISHPIKVTQIGTLTPKYKTTLRSDVFKRLCDKYITQEYLSELPLHVVQNILQIHNPTTNIVENGEFKEPYLEALKFTELYEHMKRLHNKRRYFDSITCKASSYRLWATTLPFTLTDEQISAIEDIENDLNKNVAAKRVVVGDVGSGKTMVILAAVFMNYPNRSILMAPTTILVNQLFQESKKFLPTLKIALLTNKHEVENLDDYDFIIGTHALLYKELPLSSLVMVDEQHRFGTAQRNLLEKLVSSNEKRPHYIQFSATPIPRTQAMIDSAYIDVSLIKKTPFKKDIETSVIHKCDFSNLISHINTELEKGNQILIVYPLVEQSEAISYQSLDESSEYWKSRYDGVYVTHGKDKNKEKVLEEFRDSGRILLSTTVVEVGISLPKLTTVVIVGAERLGLSTLHQLRGRVSRTGLKGYCFLYTNLEKSKRLDEFSRCENGFDIAELDLKFRSSGDLIAGKNQSGKEFKWVDLSSDINIVLQVKQMIKNI